MLLLYLDQWKVKKELYRHMISMLCKDFQSIGAVVLDNSLQRK
jgi:hypothetical protein